MSIEQQNQIRELQERVARLEALLQQILDNQALASQPRPTLTLPKKANG